jgi:hypothetical protein
MKKIIAFGVAIIVIFAGFGCVQEHAENHIEKVRVSGINTKDNLVAVVDNEGDVWCFYYDEITFGLNDEIAVVFNENDEIINFF